MKFLISLLLSLVVGSAWAQNKTELTFYYPIAVGGPLTKVIDNLVAGFEKEHPNVKITAVYAGNYDDARIKALAALPSLDELRATIVGLIQAPASKIARTINEPGAQLARIFGAYAAKEAA